jgi:hypothetical protein
MNYAEVYGEMHGNQKYFPGFSITEYIDVIAEAVKACKPERILDYGSGKGYQYLVRREHEKWGGLLPYCYDVGVRHLSGRPPGKFQFIICTDVLEHIEEHDLSTFLADVFSFADSAACMVFFSICCVPARHKVLPDGRNVHVTVRPKEWWAELLKAHCPEHIALVTVYDEGL